MENKPKKTLEERIQSLENIQGYHSEIMAKFLPEIMRETYNVRREMMDANNLLITLSKDFIARNDKEEEVKKSAKAALARAETAQEKGEALIADMADKLMNKPPGDSSGA